MGLMHGESSIQGPNYALLFEDASGRLREITALLQAIEAGELLSVLPAGPDAQRHQIGLSLLSVMSRELGNRSDPACKRTYGTSAMSQKGAILIRLHATRLDCIYLANPAPVAESERWFVGGSD